MEKVCNNFLFESFFTNKIKPHKTVNRQNFSCLLIIVQERVLLGRIISVKGRTLYMQGCSWSVSEKITQNGTHILHKTFFGYAKKREILKLCVQMAM